MKKILLWLLVLTMCISIVASFSLAEGVTLSLLVNQTWNKPSLRVALDDFMAKNPDIKVDLQVIPDAQYPELLSTKVAAKNIPDITMYNIVHLKNYLNFEKNLLPLTDEMWTSRLVNPKSVTFYNEVYGLPMNAMGSLIGFIYNKDVFEKHNIEIPRNYDELLAVLEKLKAAGVNPIMLTARDAWTAVMWTVTIFPNAIKDDAKIWEKINTGKAKFSDYPEFEDAFTKYLNIVNMKYVNDDYLSSTYDMGVESVANGESAMLVQGDWWASDVTKKYPDSNLGIFPVPLQEDARLGNGHIQTYVIFKDTKYPEQSKKLLDYFAQVDVMTATNKDWNSIPGLSDIQIDLPYYVETALNEYVYAEGMGLPYPDMSINLVVDIEELINITQEMIAGGLTPKEAIAEWDDHFAIQAKARKLPGW